MSIVDFLLGFSIVYIVLLLVGVATMAIMAIVEIVAR